MSTQFKRTTDLKRSSGLRLSTPVRSLVERVAESAGINYSDAIRLLVEEALAARAGEREKLATTLGSLIFYAYNTSTSQDEMQQKIDAMQWQIEKVLDLLAKKEMQEQERRYTAMGLDL